MQESRCLKLCWIPSTNIETALLTIPQAKIIGSWYTFPHNSARLLPWGRLHRHLPTCLQDIFSLTHVHLIVSLFVIDWRSPMSILNHWSQIPLTGGLIFKRCDQTSDCTVLMAWRHFSDPVDLGDLFGGGDLRITGKVSCIELHGMRVSWSRVVLWIFADKSD